MRLNRIVRAAIAMATSAALAGAAWAVSTTPAHAVGYACYLYPPSKLVISSKTITVRGTYSSGCRSTPGGTYAPEWDANGGPYGDYFEAQLKYPATSYHRTDLVHLGTWTWYNETDQADNRGMHTTARLASHAYISTVRNGSSVGISIRDTRYFQNYYYNKTLAGKFYYHAGWKGQIQWRYVGYQTWHALHNATLSSTGYAYFGWTQPYARQYRVVFPDNTSVWGSISATSQL